MAAPIASQVLGEVLPYLDVVKANEEQKNSVIVPNVTNLSFKEAKNILKESGLSYEIVNNNSNADIENTIILDQLPKKGISVLEGTKIVLYLD